MTSLSLVISNSATVYSNLLLARGRPALDTDFDFIARLDGATNRIELEPPEFAATNYGLRAKTPAGSLTHAFQVNLTTNRTDLCSAAFPVLKPVAFTTTGTLINADSQAAWHYVQVDVPTHLPGWRLVLETPGGGGADFYVRRGALPTYRLLASTNLMTWVGIATNTPIAYPSCSPTRTPRHLNRMYRLLTP